MAAKSILCLHAGCDITSIFCGKDKVNLLKILLKSRRYIVTIANTAQKMKFSIKDFCSKCDQIRSFLRIWSHLLMKSIVENFIFCAVQN